MLPFLGAGSHSYFGELFYKRNKRLCCQDFLTKQFIGDPELGILKLICRNLLQGTTLFENKSEKWVDAVENYFDHEITAVKYFDKKTNEARRLFLYYLVLFFPFLLHVPTLMITAPRWINKTVSRNYETENCFQAQENFFLFVPKIIVTPLFSEAQNFSSGLVYSFSYFH